MAEDKQWLQTKYNEFLKTDLTGDGTPDLEQFKSWLSNQGDEVGTRAEKAFASLKETGEDVGGMLQGWAQKAADKAEEVTSEGSFLDNNKFGLMATMGGLLVGMLLGGGPMMMIMMAMLGAVVGSMLGDKEEGVMGGLHNKMFKHGDHGHKTELGKTMAMEGPDLEATNETVINLTADGKLTTKENAEIIVRGNFEGEGAEQKFIPRGAAMRGEDGKFALGEDGKVEGNAIDALNELKLDARDGAIIESESNTKALGAIATTANAVITAAKEEAKTDEPKKEAKSEGQTAEPSAKQPATTETRTAEKTEAEPSKDPEKLAALSDDYNKGKFDNIPVGGNNSSLPLDRDKLPLAPDLP
ncbi:MAG: hypothetical protein ACN2B6_05870 [Rickettsiales bacterium]